MKHTNILLVLSGALCTALCACGENASESQAAARAQTPVSIDRSSEPLQDPAANRTPVMPPPPAPVPVDPRDIDTRSTDPVGTDATVTNTTPNTSQSGTDTSKPKPDSDTPENDAGMSDSLTPPVLPPPQSPPNTAAVPVTKPTTTGSKENTDTTARLGTMDTEFVTKATLVGLFEVQSSELAVSQATTPFVRDFAQMMVLDHGEANRDLEKLARGKGAVVPTDLDTEYASRLSTLRDQTGVNFDRQYRDMQVTAHKDAIALFDRAAADCEDDELKAYAKKLLPKLREHQKKLNEMPPTNGG